MKYLGERLLGSMNSKEVPPESSSTSGRRTRRNNNNHATAYPANYQRRIVSEPTSHRDFMNMFADLDLTLDRVTDGNRRTPEPTTAIPEMPVSDMTPPTLNMRDLFTPRGFGFMSPQNAGNPVEGADVDDDASFGSLPALVQRVDSSDEESSDDEENEVMSYDSLPSLVTRSDSSDEEDDCTLPSLVSGVEEDSLPPLLRRRNNNTLENVGRLHGELQAIPGLLHRRVTLFQRRDESESDDDSDDDSNCSSDDSSESDGETYWEAAELEMETSNNRFDNEAIIDNRSGISSSQRRVNRFSGSSSVRRNLSRVRCRCLARVSNTQAWITLRDNMRVRGTVQ